METKKAMMPVNISIHDWHTKLYKNVIDGVSDNDAHNRLNTKANHVAWIAGSLVYGRYELAKLLGLNPDQLTYHELFKDFKGIRDNATYPSIEEYRKD